MCWQTPGYIFNTVHFPCNCLINTSLFPNKLTIDFIAPAHFGCKLQPSTGGCNCCRRVQHAIQVVEHKR